MKATSLHRLRLNRINYCSFYTKPLVIKRDNNNQDSRFTTILRTMDIVSGDLKTFRSKLVSLEKSYYEVEGKLDSIEKQLKASPLQAINVQSYNKFKDDVSVKFTQFSTNMDKIKQEIVDAKRELLKDIKKNGGDIEALKKHIKDIDDVVDNKEIEVLKEKIEDIQEENKKYLEETLKKHKEELTQKFDDFKHAELKVDDDDDANDNLTRKKVNTIENDEPDYEDSTIDMSGTKVDFSSLSLALKENMIDTLILKGCNITPSGISKLSRSLRTNNTLKFLDLSENELGDEGAGLIAHVLKVNTTITYLNLSNNKISDYGATQIGHLLKLSPKIEVLELSGNEIQDEGALSISLGVKLNNAIKRVNLRDNKIGKRGAKFALQAFHLTPSVEIIDLRGNPEVTKRQIMLRE